MHSRRSSARWRFLHAPPRSGAENMARDAALMHHAAVSGESVFSVYSWSAPTLSLGRHQRAAGKYDRERLTSRGISVVRRTGFCSPLSPGSASVRRLPARALRLRSRPARSPVSRSRPKVKLSRTERSSSAARSGATRGRSSSTDRFSSRTIRLRSPISRRAAPTRMSEPRLRAPRRSTICLDARPKQPSSQTPPSKL